MWVYIIIFLFLIIGLSYENRNNTNKLLGFAFFLIFLLFALRSYNVGSDTNSYILEYIWGTSDLRSIDKGFAFLTGAIYNFGFPPRGFLIIISFIIVVPVYLFIRRWTPDNRMFITILYMTIGTMAFNLTGMRQSIAISVILSSLIIISYLKRPIFQYIVLVLSIALAVPFHYSSQICVLFLPLLYLSKRKFIFRNKLIWICLCVPIVGLFLGSYYGIVIERFMVAKYENYEANFGDANIISYFIIPYTMFIYVTWLLSKAKEIGVVERFSYLCALFYTFFASASVYMPILARFEYYFSLQFMCLIGCLTARLPKKERSLVLYGITAICIAFFLIVVPGGTLSIDNYMFGTDIF